MNSGFVFFLRAVCMDDDIVHIHGSFTQVDQVHELVIHHRLESCQGVGEAKKHDGGLEEPITRFEGGLPFVSFLDANVVISPANVEFGEPFLARDTMDKLGDQWEGIAVRHSPFVQVSIVLDWPKFPILLFDEEESAGIGGFGMTNSF